MASRVVAAAVLIGLVACGDDLRPPALDAAPGGVAPGAPAPIGPTDPAWPEAGELPAAFDLPPWVTLPGDGTVAIGWQTVRPTTGWVEIVASPDGRLAVDWGAADRFERDDPAPATLHHVRATGLAPATAYRFRVHVDDDPGGPAVREGVVVTPGATGFRFVHLAEFHAPSDADQVARFAEHLVAFRPHLIVESGDMVDAGGDAEHWRSYLVTSAPWISNVVLLPAHSNHVNGSLGNPFIRALFELPDNERWYATRYGAIELVTLDSTFGENPDVAIEPAWVRDRLAAELAAADPPARIVAAWHYPACSSHYAGRTASRRWVIEHLLPAFDAAGGLDLLLVGHDKYYERSRLVRDGRATTQVMVNAGRLAPGGAGGDEPECTALVTETGRRSLGLYEIDGAAIRGRAIAPDGVELDRFAIGVAAR